MEFDKFIFIGILFFIAIAKISGSTGENKCNGMSCGDCMDAGPHCAWCASVDFTGGEWERCQDIRNFKRQKSCNKRQLMTTSSTPILQKNEIEENLVSISKVTMHMRKGSRISFPLTVMVPRNSRRKKENVMVIGWRSGKKPVELDIQSDCKNKKSKGHKFVCKKVKKGRQVTFELTTHLKTCQGKRRSGRYKIIVKIGKSKKIIQVEARYVCHCKVLENKKKCFYNSRRNLLEGQCVVQATVTEEIPPPMEPQIPDRGWCPLSVDQARLQCINNGDIESEVCSGNGQCECGKCKCNNLYYGDFCECSDHTCPRFKGFLCGGPSRGKCGCGKCECADGHTGNNCGCPTTNTTCLASDGSLCNNAGFCICGACTCQKSYTGSRCEDCPTCTLSCDRFKQCAECLAAVGSRIQRSMCRTVCNGDVPSYGIRDKLLGTEEEGKTCHFVGHDGCPLNFKILTEPSSNAYELDIERRIDCIKSHKCRSDDHCESVNGTVCSRRGNCNCGYCECESGFTGSTCEQCTECSDVCNKYRDCVSCVAFESGILSPTECQQECSAIRSKIKLVPTMIGDIGKSCQYRDLVDGCIVNYAVKHNRRGEPRISVLNQRVGCGIGGPIMDRSRSERFYGN